MVYWIGGTQVCLGTVLGGTQSTWDQNKVVTPFFVGFSWVGSGSVPGRVVQQVWGAPSQLFRRRCISTVSQIYINRISNVSQAVYKKVHLNCVSDGSVAVCQSFQFSLTRRTICVISENGEQYDKQCCCSCRNGSCQSNFHWTAELQW